MAKMITKREAEKVAKHGRLLYAMFALLLLQVIFDGFVLWTR